MTDASRRLHGTALLVGAVLGSEQGLTFAGDLRELLAPLPRALAWARRFGDGEDALAALDRLLAVVETLEQGARIVVDAATDGVSEEEAFASFAGALPRRTVSVDHEDPCDGGFIAASLREEDGS